MTILIKKLKRSTNYVINKILNSNIESIIYISMISIYALEYHETS